MTHPAQTEAAPEYSLKQELHILDPKRLRIYFDGFEDLTLEVEGQEPVKPVSVVRAFPITDRDRFLILKDKDGKEIGIVLNLADLDSGSRKALTAELEQVYFTPKILFVHDIQEQFHVPKWDVETDRGPRVFEVRGGRQNDVRTIGAGRILIRDADGNQYEIPDYRELDPISRALVEGQL